MGMMPYNSTVRDGNSSMSVTTMAFTAALAPRAPLEAYSRPHACFFSL